MELLRDAAVRQVALESEKAALAARVAELGAALSEAEAGRQTAASEAAKGAEEVRGRGGRWKEETRVCAHLDAWR